MFKYSILLMVVLIGCSTAASLFDEFDIGECPDYKSMDNLDVNKISGIWYSFAIEKDSKVDPSLSCNKLNLVYNKNGTFTLDETIIKIDGSEQNQHSIYTTESEHPGELFIKGTVEDVTFLGPQTRHPTVRVAVIYTDYENIAVLYWCFETEYYMFTKKNDRFNIVIRNRDFDSLNVFGEAAAALKNLDFELDDMRFVYNGPNCKN